MNRQTRTFVVLVVAVVVAAGASYAVYRAVASIPVRQVEIATAKAVVAAKPMPVGTLVTRESFLGFSAVSRFNVSSSNSRPFSRRVTNADIA